jgi:hypothetical protein
LNSKALQSLLKVLLNGIKINLKNKFNIVKNSILVLLLEVHFKNHHAENNLGKTFNHQIDPIYPKINFKFLRFLMNFYYKK